MEARVNHIWCTLVMCGDGYVPGALVLARSIREHKSKYPAWCMVTPDVSVGAREILAKSFDRVIPVDYIEHPCRKMLSTKQQRMYGAWIERSFTKWRILDDTLFPVDKIMFVDADIIFLENIDELFGLDAPAATYSLPWAQPWTDGGMYNPYGVLKHGDKVPLAAVSKGLDPPMPSMVGLGSMVLVRPDRAVYTRMVSVLTDNTTYGHRLCTSGFDEQLLAETFLRCKLTPTYIHQRYNWHAGKDYWLEKGDRPRVRHYFNDKPWNQARDTWSDLADWWAHADALMSADPAAASWFVIKPR